MSGAFGLGPGLGALEVQGADHEGVTVWVAI